MRPSISFWTRLFDLIAPRCCVVCGRRLSITEEVICLTCNRHLPRTGFQKNPYENEMAKMFWHLMPIERAAALFFYESHSEVCNIIYELKYNDYPEVGVVMGRQMAKEFEESHFFDGIDAIIPIPLAKKRERERGYNQSEKIAEGIHEVTGIPVMDQMVKRSRFDSSQTRLNRWERLENVEHLYQPTQETEQLQGKHILLVDDVVTTGATVLACADCLKHIPHIRFSVVSLGYTHE